jgi:tetratricopeptide (TPR) repeat protein
LFGAPIAHEDHAVRACHAALRMQERVKRHAAGVFHTHGVNVQIRVGLNSGEVVVRTIHGDLHMDYTAIGRTTHLAARMEQLANPGSILLAPATRTLAEGFIAVKPLGSVPVKGLADPLEIHELTGIGPARTRLQALAGRDLTRFVGRDPELDLLYAAQRRAAEGHGQVTALVAEAGVGKSRLVHEFTHSHHLGGWLVMESAAASYGRSMSYLAIANLLKGYFGVRDQDSLEATSEKVASKLRLLDRALEPTLPPLLALLDVPVLDTAWQALAPAQRRRRMLDGVRHLLLREARRQPVLLIFEDLHWVDPESQALLDDLVDNLGSAPILLLATYRPEYQHGWGKKTYYAQIRLDALAAEGVGQLLDALLGKDPTLAPLKQLLVERGNPFVLEETVQTLLETKALDGTAGSYRLIRPVDAIRIPATVQVMLAARIDRLSVDDKRLLQVAAVLGRRIPFAVLQVVAELPDEALRDALHRLQAAEFVYDTGPVPDLEYSFKHALTQDVAYGGMLHERRRELHARIVEALEVLHGERLGEQVELLAHHAQRGDLREKAVSYLFQAGLKAGMHSALQTAAGWYEQALLVLDALPDSRSKLERGFDIRIQMRGALNNLGETRKALQRLKEAEPIAEKLDDEGRRGIFYAGMCLMNTFHGELDEALANGARALAIADKLRDAALRANTGIYLVMAHWYRGDYERVVELVSASTAEMPSSGTAGSAHSPAPIWERCNLVRSLAELGRFAEAARYAHQVVQFAQPIHGPHIVGMARLSAGLGLLAEGDWAQARPLIEHGLSEYRKGSIFIGLPHAVASSALVLARVGETAEAWSLVQEGEERLDGLAARGTIDQLGMDYHWLGGAALLLGRLDDARRLAEKAVRNSPAHRGFAAHAMHLLGDVASHPDRFDAEAGKSHYGKALLAAESLEMRPLIGHCHLGLGRLYRHTGQTTQAREHLAMATSLYRAMDMTFWQNEAEALG